VEGNDRADTVRACCAQKLAEERSGSQLDIQVASVRKKLVEEGAALPRRSAVGTTFRGMARRHDQRRRQLSDGFFDSVDHMEETVEAQLEKVGRISHPKRPLKIGA
jgi:hypothetical protein